MSKDNKKSNTIQTIKLDRIRILTGYQPADGASPPHPSALPTEEPSVTKPKEFKCPFCQKSW